MPERTKDGYIHSKEDLKRFLAVESRLYNQKSMRIPLFPVWENQILWKHAALLRKREYYTNTGRELLRRFYARRLVRLQNKHALHIPINCFDCGLRIMHLGPILVNQKVRVGKNCSLHTNTAIVAGGTNSGVPRLGDGIAVGVGAVILGDIVLANHLAVGAGAVVNRSFAEENITIAGVPAKKISDYGSEAWKNSRQKRA